MDRTILLWKNKRNFDALTNKIRPLINWSVGSLEHIMNHNAASIGNDSAVMTNAFFDYQFNGIISNNRVESAQKNLSLLIDYIFSTFHIDEENRIMELIIENLLKEFLEWILESIKKFNVEDEDILEALFGFNNRFDGLRDRFAEASSLLESEQDMTILDFLKLILQQAFGEEIKNKAQSCANFEQYDTAERIIKNAYNYPSECECHPGFHGQWCDQQNECTCRLGIASKGIDWVGTLCRWHNSRSRVNREPTGEILIFFPWRTHYAYYRFFEILPVESRLMFVKFIEPPESYGVVFLR